MNRLLVALLMTVPAIVRADPPAKPLYQLDAAGVDALIQKTYQSTPKAGDRLVRYSEGFLGMPYGLFPLGIAPKNGAETPPIRFDTADCTTMVETLMAMSLAPDLETASKNMAKVRYKGGVVSLASKNDIAETDWLPNNISAGLLTDITSSVAGADTAVSTKTVKVKQYDQSEIDEITDLASTAPDRAIDLLRSANGIGAHFQEKKATLPIVPLAILPRVGKQIPSGAIFSLVRENRADKEIMVTHQGLVVQKPDGPYIRHMAFKGKGVDVPLTDFFSQYRNSAWKVLGINLTFISEPPPPKKTP